MTKVYNAGTQNSITFADGSNNLTIDYSEGDGESYFIDILFVGGNNYNEELTLMIDSDSTRSKLINITSTNYEAVKYDLRSEADEYRTVAPLNKLSDASYTVKSYTSGVNSNNFDALKKCIERFEITLHSDMDDNFTLTFSLVGDHLQNPTNTIITAQFNATSVIDAININQNNTIDEDRVVWRFDFDGQGVPQVQDQLGPDSGRTYRITFSPKTPEDSKYNFYLNHPDANEQYNSTISFEGNQNTVNDIMLGGEGKAFHVDMLEDEVGSFDIEYKQEVISGAPNTPYVQEIGNFNFVVNELPEYTRQEVWSYDEDRVLVFTPLVITELGYHRYKVTLTLSDVNAGTLNQGTDLGNGVYEFIGSRDELNAVFTNMQYFPSPDYRNNFVISFAIVNDDNGKDKGGDIIQMNIGQTDDNQYDVNLGPYSWGINNDNPLSDFATITDSKHIDFQNVVYQAIVELVPPADNNNGELRTFGTGGSSTWDAPTATLVIEGAYEAVQSHLDAIEWWSRGPTDAFTMNSRLLRKIDTGGFVEINVTTGIQMNEGVILPSPVNTNLSRVYDEDSKTNFNDETKAGDS